MSFIFFTIVTLGLIMLTAKNPTDVFTVFTQSGDKSVKLAFGLLSSYAVWLGIFELLEISGFNKFLSKILSKPIKFLFGKIDDNSKSLISANISANILGMNDIATPSGIKACESLDKNNNVYAQSMLFILCATGLQLFPTSVISLRSAYNSFSPLDIFLPAVICTICSTLVGIILTKILVKR